MKRLAYSLIFIGFPSHYFREWFDPSDEYAMQKLEKQARKKSQYLGVFKCHCINDCY